MERNGKQYDKKCLIDEQLQSQVAVEKGKWRQALKEGVVLHKI